MNFEIKMVNLDSQTFELAGWLVEHISPYRAYEPKLNYFDGEGWSMRGIRRSAARSANLFAYTWFWQITIDDEKLATEFALRFL